MTPPGTCGECGFDYEAVSPADAAVTIRSFERRFRAPLTRFLPGEDGDAVVRARPEPGVWSALEYAAHVRNSLQLAKHSIERTTTEDHPRFPPIDPDGEVVRLRFNDEEAKSVGDQIAVITAELADLIEQVPAGNWSRTAEIPVLGQVDALWFARNAVHEGHHHLLDVGRVLRAVRQQSKK